MENIKYWIWFSRIPKLGSIKKQKLLGIYNTPYNIWNLTKQELAKVEGIGEEVALKILDKRYRSGLDRYEEYMKKNNIELIHIYDRYYPKKLQQIYDKPIVLFVKGDKKILNEFTLAIVGCRENSKYGEIVAKSISHEIAKNRNSYYKRIGKRNRQYCT